MYSLRVNAKTKQLVETVADMVGLSVSSIMRKVKRKMEKGKIFPADGKDYSVVHLNGDVINIKIPKTYHMGLSEWITADMDPVDGHNINLFRSCLVAACLDVKTRSAAQHQKIVKLNKELKEYENYFVTERRALYAEVM